MRCRCWWGLSIVASIHLTQLARPGLSFEPSPVPPSVLFASIFFFFACCIPRTRPLCKGPHAECALAIGPGAAGAAGASDSGRPERGHLSVDRFSSHQKVTESDGTGGRFSGPGRFVARKHAQRWDAPQRPPPLRITREASSRPGFHPGRFPALLSQGGSGAFVKASRSWYFGLDLDPTSTRSSCWCALLSGSTSRSGMSRFEVS